MKNLILVCWDCNNESQASCDAIVKEFGHTCKWCGSKNVIEKQIKQLFKTKTALTFNKNT
jgi:hypothetical protein